MPTSDKKISQLPVATSINPTDLHVIVQGGVTKQIEHSNVQGSYLASANNLNDVADAASARANLDVLSEGEVVQLIYNTFAEGYIMPGSPGVPPGTNYQSGFVAAADPLKVYICGLDSKQVFFRGMVDVSGYTFSPGTFAHVFTLTAPFRPPHTVHFPVVGLYAAIGLVSIQPDGKVYLMNGMVGDLQTSGIVDFSNISYTVLNI